MKPLSTEDYGRISSTLLLNRMFAQGGLGDQSLDSWLSVFVRKVDLASDEYQVAFQLREAHGIRDSSGAVTMTLPAAGDHLELSILSLRRAVRCLERLIASRDVPALDRLLKRRIENATKALLPVRNTIEHIDEEVNRGLADQQPHTLRISDDGQTATIAGQVLPLDDLHRCITLLRQVAHEFACYTRKTATETGSQP
jgi:hypothetical protein